MTKIRSTSKFSHRLHPAGILLLVLAFGWLLRGSVLFRTELVPAVNGAYYLIQSRSILHT